MVIDKVSEEAWLAITALLKPAMPNITPTRLQEALADYEAKLRHPQTSSSEDRHTELVTIREAAAWLKVSVATIYRMLRRGALQRCKLANGVTRITADSIEDQIEHARHLAEHRADLIARGILKGGERA